MELKELLPEKRALEVEIVPGRPRLPITYQPMLVTQEHLDQLETAPPEKHFDVLCLSLQMFGMEWDLTIDGEPVPATADGLKRVPIAVLPLIFRAIIGDASPNLPVAENSEDGWPPEETSEAAPTGTA